jgi:hypothetical protein
MVGGVRQGVFAPRGQDYAARRGLRLLNRIATMSIVTSVLAINRIADLVCSVLSNVLGM